MSGVFHSIESSGVYVGVQDDRSMADGVDGGEGAAAAHKEEGDGAAAAHRDAVGFVGGLCFGLKNISCLSRAKTFDCFLTFVSLCFLENRS